MNSTREDIYYYLGEFFLGAASILESNELKLEEKKNEFDKIRNKYLDQIMDRVEE